MKPDDAVAVDVDAVQFSRTLRQAILLPACVIFLTALALLLLGYEFLEVIKKSDHSREVELQTQRCMESVLEAETGVRGYLLQGNPAFLDPYDKAIVSIDDDFQKLKNLVGGNRESIALAAQLIQAKDIWLQHAKSSVDQRRHGKIPDEDWDKMGKMLMDDIRARFDAFTAAETQIREVRHHDVQEARWVLVL